MLQRILIGICIISILIVGVVINMQDKPREYRNFTELKEHEQENIDYRITAFQRKPEITVMAIHGGNIEIGTSEVAVELGEKLDASTYLFEGLKAKNNSKLHITSTSYDEPVAVGMAKKAATILSIHGYRDTEDEKVYVGGKNDEYKKLVKKHLKREGFDVEEAPSHLSGTDKKNIANQNASGEAVQLELSTKLRESFFKNKDFSMNNRKQKTDEFYEFVEALEKATEKYKEKNEE